MRLTIAVSLALVAAVASPSARAQAPKSENKDPLLMIRPMYYTPTSRGMSSFHCSISIDWKDLLTRAKGVDVAPDDAFLQYLNSSRISVTDRLKGTSTTEWSNTSTPPEGKETAADQIRSGFTQTIDGFFTSWNGFTNGSLMPYPDKSMPAKITGTGLNLHGTAGTMTVDENLDKNGLVTDVTAASPDSVTVAYPTYIQTPDGLVLSTVKSVIRQPPSAPPVEVTFAVQYATVTTFRLPAALQVQVQNVTALNFKFTDCTVELAVSAPEKP